MLKFSSLKSRFLIIIFGFMVLCIILLKNNEFYSPEYYSYIFPTQDNSLEKNYNLKVTKDYCVENSEWETIGNYIFIKKSSVFYHVDTSELYFSYIGSIHKDTNLTVELQIIHNKEKYQVKIEEGFEIYKIAALEATGLTQKNKLQEYFFKNTVKNYEFFRINDVKLSVYMIDKLSGRRTQYPIAVKLKYKVPKSKKKFIMICSKPYFGDKTYPKDFDLWFTYARKIGFSKIAFGNHSLFANNAVKRDEFNTVVKKHKGLISIIPSICLPDVSGILDRNDTNPKYIKNDKLTQDYYYAMDITFQNECFNENKNDFEYIFIADTDELILPKLIEHKNNDQVIDYISKIDLQNSKKAMKDIFSIRCKKESGSRSPAMSNFIQELQSNLKFNSDSSLRFCWAIYIKDETVENIMKNLQILLLTKTESYTLMNNETLSIDWKNSVGNYKFAINSQKELDYALKLNGIYRNYLRPLSGLLKFYNISTGRHDRYFKIISNTFKNDSYEGIQKSIESTESHSFARFHRSPGPSFLIPKNMGDTAHFREDEFKFADLSPITDLVLDLNYLNCFYFEVLNEFYPEAQKLINEALK